MALNENVWQVLKPLLVAQHEVALKKEEEFSAANKNLPTQAEERGAQEEQLQQARTLLERQRDEAQRPVREKLAAYADELMESEWDGGSFVTKENAPQFAADLLIYVRRKFFEAVDENHGVPLRQETDAPSALPGSNSDRHLTLEDMKWVYETKIKPITQRYSKEIFLCGACDVDRKHYALDAVIQHYAAKHTNNFSHGSAVVYWKADWPLEPPFDKKPISSPKNRQLDHSGVTPMYQRDLTRPQQFEPAFAVPEQKYPTRSTFGMTPEMAPRLLERYAPSVYSVDEELYQPRSFFVPVQSSNAVPTRGIYGVETARERIAYETYYGPKTPVSPAFSTHVLAATPYRGYAAEASRRPYPVPHYSASVVSPVAANGYGHPPPPAGRGSRLEPRPFPYQGQPSGLHQTQIADLAINAREIWDSTDGIDDLPDSIRTHVIIHHVVLRYHKQYANKPTLALFADALRNSSQMRPLIALDGLLCKACASQDGHNSNYDARLTKYSLLELLNHFQSSHTESSMSRVADTAFEVHIPDWIFDMVLLPDEHTIKSLIDSPGMTDAKLLLIATILPKCFPKPLPRLGRTPQSRTTIDSTTHTEALARPKTRPHSPSVAPDDACNFIPLDMPTNGTQSLAANLDQGQEELRPRVTEVVREDEYDPHRPAPTHAGPVPEYELQQPRPLYRAPVQAYDEQAFEDIVPPPYSIVEPSSPRNHYYGPRSSEVRSYEDPSRIRPYADNRYDAGVRHSRDALFATRQSRPILSSYVRYDAQQSPAAPISTTLRGQAVYEPRSFEVDRVHDRPRTPIEQVKVEAARTPTRNSITGTAQFLNGFDADGSPKDRPNTPNQASLPDRASNNASSHRSGRAAASVRHPRSRLDALERPGTGVSSRRGSPQRGLSRNGINARSRSPSVVPRDGPRLRVDEPRFRHPAHLPLESEPVQQLQYHDPRYLDRPIHQDERFAGNYEPLQRYRTRSPGRGQQDIPIRYIDARPIPRYFYPDETPYQQAGEEYVMPREGPRHLERRVVLEHYPEYVEDNAGYGRAIDDRDGRVYEAIPPPRRQARHDPYDDRQRYQ